MPQSLLLKGVKDVVNYTTTDGTFPLRLKQNLRGGSTFQIKQWWAKKGNNTVYNSCTVFEIEGSDNYVVIPTSTSTQLGIGYDGDIYNMTFTNYNEVDRVAIFNVNDLLVCEYLFPSVSGGTIAKRTVVPQPIIGAVSITGTRNPVAGVANNYSASIGGTATDETYVWTTTDDGATIVNGNTSSPTITYSAEGTYTTNVKVTSNLSTDSPTNKPIAITCTAPISIGNATASGPATAYTGQPETYSVSIDGNAQDATYAWETTDSGANISGISSVNAAITFSVPGNYDVKCVVSSGSSTPSSVTSSVQPVAVTTQVLIGTVTIVGPATGTTNVAGSYTANYDGNAGSADAVYNWTIAPDTPGAIATAGAKTTDVTLATEDNYTLSCSVSAATADDSPQSDDLNIAITAPAP